MTKKIVESESWDSGDQTPPKLPTLTNVFDQLGKGTYGLSSCVKTIFVNRKFKNITLVVEDDYRVILYEGTQLFKVVDSNLEDWFVDGNICVRINPSLEFAGKFVLSLDRSFDPAWKSFDWGYVIENNPGS